MRQHSGSVKSVQQAVGTGRFLADERLMCRKALL